MTDLERMQTEANLCHDIILGKLADLAADAGDDALQRGYLWLMDNRRWPAKFKVFVRWANPGSYTDNEPVHEELAGWLGHEQTMDPREFPAHQLASNLRTRMRSRGDDYKTLERHWTFYPDVATALAVAARVVGDWLVAKEKPKKKPAIRKGLWKHLL